MLNTALWPKSSGAPSELNCSYFIIPGVPLRSTPGSSGRAFGAKEHLLQRATEHISLNLAYFCQELLSLFYALG
jgi:hypothetical protein